MIEKHFLYYYTKLTKIDYNWENSIADMLNNGAQNYRMHMDCICNKIIDKKLKQQNAIVAYYSVLQS